MARRKAAIKRVIIADPVFGSEMIAKFVNVVMRRGKKAVAEKIVYGALNKIVARKKGKAEEGEGAEKVSKSADSQGGIFSSEPLRKIALEQFEKSINAARPTVEVRSRRVGGATYQIPVEVRPDRSIALAMRWLVQGANQRGEKGMELRLAGEMMDAIEGKGWAIKKREDTHKIAKANQAFAHYRW
jgi:small subunit ribosomal protein S7